MRARSHVRRARSGTVTAPELPRPERHGQELRRLRGSYESSTTADSSTDETSDTMCYPQGDTHPGYNGPGTFTAPVQVSHCQDSIFQNGDLDFDGTPYWSSLRFSSGDCSLEFGNVSAGFGVNNYGKDGQYGTNQYPTLGYPEFESAVHNNPCAFRF
jgi:hypothetical protein